MLKVWLGTLRLRKELMKLWRKQSPENQQQRKERQHRVIELPEISSTSTRAEIAAFFAAAEKINNDSSVKAIARDKLKKAQQTRARG